LTRDRRAVRVRSTHRSAADCDLHHQGDEDLGEADLDLAVNVRLPQPAKHISRRRRLYGGLLFDRRGAELLFQVLTEREERSALGIACNEPFSKSHRFAATDARACLNLTGAA
jgi:hypothetical protein